MPRASTARFDAAIGGNLRRFRKSAELSQGKLAEMVGVTTQQISKYEKGDDRISAPMLAKLANALRIVVGELLQGTTILAETPAGGFAEAPPQSSYKSLSAEDGRRALLLVYDQLDQPLKDVALKQVQALLYLQAANSPN